MFVGCWSMSARLRRPPVWLREEDRRDGEPGSIPFPRPASETGASLTPFIPDGGGIRQHLPVEPFQRGLFGLASMVHGALAGDLRASWGVWAGWGFPATMIALA